MSFPFPLPLLLDGATGTNLYRAGMPKNACPETWVLDHPEALLSLQREFAGAGSGAVYAPTFSANGVRLAAWGLEGRAGELNRRLAALSREAVGPGVLVGGDLSPTGESCEPFGRGRFLDHVGAYAEQALALREAGVDFLVCETMYSLTEARAALLGALQARLPVFVTMTVDEDGRTMAQTDALAALITLQALGACAFGLNCSMGADAMEGPLRRLAPFARVPLIAKPSAGLPDPETGAYPQSPEEMAASMRRLLEAGAQIIGGCCGATPEHIAAMNRMLQGFDFSRVRVERDPSGMVVCNATGVFFLEEDFELSEPLECGLDMADDLLDAEDAGCDVISVHLLDQESAFCFSQNMHMARLPVSFLAETEEALEYGLLFYNGRAIVDSRSEAPRERLEELAAGYGAVLR